MLVTSIRSPDYLRFNLVIKLEGSRNSLPLPSVVSWEQLTELGKTVYFNLLVYHKRYRLGFPGGTVDRNLPTNAGDTSSILRPGDSTCLGATKPVCHNYWARVLQLLKPVCLEPVLCNTGSHCDEKPVHHDDSKSQSPRCSNKDSVLPKINKSIS